MSLKVFILFLFSAVIVSCTHQGETAQQKNNEAPLRLTLEQANALSSLPLACAQTEYPNKLGQTLASAEDIGEPHVLHPAFYGCFDWHSAVHGHWSMVKLLSVFPDIEDEESIRQILRENITAETIRSEVDYFNEPSNYSYERMYGWAWLLKLAQALEEWDDPQADTLSTHLQPLTDLIADQYIMFLPKLQYPIRVGTHTNSAFGISFAYDYAVHVDHTTLRNAIETAAIRFYKNDIQCPINWEPSGYDFLSPCLEEVDVMRRVLNENDFLQWLHDFMPALFDKDFRMEPGIVSDREDGHLVHLDGVNFSRAWVLYGLANQYDSFAHLNKLANEHVQHSLPELVGDAYEGGHWLGSFAIYALTTD